jgi:hypothetical protein
VLFDGFAQPPSLHEPGLPSILCACVWRSAWEELPGNTLASCSRCGR